MEGVVGGRRTGFEWNCVRESDARLGGARVCLNTENAFRKRKVSADSLDKLTTEIDIEVAAHTHSELEASSIGRLILHKLSEIDQVAYVRFASVYCEVNSLDDFLSLLSIDENRLIKTIEKEV